MGDILNNNTKVVEAEYVFANLEERVFRIVKGRTHFAGKKKGIIFDGQEGILMLAKEVSSVVESYN